MVQRHGKRAVLCRCLDGRRGLGIDKVSYRATCGVQLWQTGSRRGVWASFTDMGGLEFIMIWK